MDHGGCHSVSWRGEGRRCLDRYTDLNEYAFGVAADKHSAVMIRAYLEYAIVLRCHCQLVDAFRLGALQ